MIAARVPLVASLVFAIAIDLGAEARAADSSSRPLLPCANDPRAPLEFPSAVVLNDYSFPGGHAMYLAEYASQRHRYADAAMLRRKQLSESRDPFNDDDLIRKPLSVALARSGDWTAARQIWKALLAKARPQEFDSLFEPLAAGNGRAALQAEPSDAKTQHDPARADVMLQRGIALSHRGEYARAAARKRGSRARAIPRHARR